MKKKMNRVKNTLMASIAVLMLVSAGIAGNTDSGLDIPGYMWIIYIAVAIVTAFLVHYNNVLKYRAEYKKERDAKRKAAEEQLAREIDAIDLSEF